MLGAKDLIVTNGHDTFAGSIGGTGGLQVAGGTQALSSAQAYSGATTISGGTLALTDAGSVAASSQVIANGTFSIAGLAGAGTSIQRLSGTGSVDLGAKTLTLTAANDTFAGVIGGSGGLTLAGGTQTLSGVNTFGGVTTISAGTLALAGAGAIGNSSHVVVGSIFDISALAGTGTNIQSLAGNGSVALGAKTLTITNANDTFAGVISGTGGLTISGGMQTLSGVNTYTRRNHGERRHACGQRQPVRRDERTCRRHAARHRYGLRHSERGYRGARQFHRHADGRGQLHRQWRNAADRDGPRRRCLADRPACRHRQHRWAAPTCG